MSDDRDPVLEGLFAEAEQELEGAAFTAQVMARSRFARGRAVAGWLAAAALLAVCALLLVPTLQDLAALLAQGLTTALVDLGDGWWALVFSPINSVAGLVVLGWKLTRMVLARARGASYA